MVVIRMQRRGSKKINRQRIVVTERTRAQSSRVLEVIGKYDPEYNPENFELNEPRFLHWISLGAQVSESLTALVKKFKKISVASLKNQS